MFKNIENLKIKNIHKGISKRFSIVNNRKSSSFVLRVAGCVQYEFAERTFIIHPGEVFFLPKGSSYTFKSVSDFSCEYIAIRFEGNIDGDTPFLFSIDRFQDADEFTNNIVNLWDFGGQAGIYRCYSIFYNLLSYMENLENQAYIDKKKLNIISPAIVYLKKHIYDCDLKIDSLIHLCGISATYFQKIFQANFATSPQKYILSKRLSHAKTLIDCGEFEKIADIASSVGYSDPLYFSRAFKKKYGVSPSEYARQ